jgi:hypothetical protein
MSADRRAGRNIPHVGREPRARNQDARWRKKRSDTGKSRTPKKRKGFLATLLGL